MTNDETEISTCEVESEQQIVTTKEAPTAYKIICHMHFWMCKICLFMSICNKTGGGKKKCKLNSINFSVFLNVI